MTVSGTRPPGQGTTPLHPRTASTKSTKLPCQPCSPPITVYEIYETPPPRHSVDSADAIHPATARRTRSPLTCAYTSVLWMLLWCSAAWTNAMSPVRL